MITIEDAIQSRLNDIMWLENEQNNEKNQDIILAWEYQINLNNAVINNLIIGNKKIVSVLMQEIIRSTNSILAYAKTVSAYAETRNR